MLAEVHSLARQITHPLVAEALALSVDLQLILLLLAVTAARELQAVLAAQALLTLAVAAVARQVMLVVVEQEAVARLAHTMEAQTEQMELLIQAVEVVVAEADRPTQAALEDQVL
jgi:hypothetical protein